MPTGASRVDTREEQQLPIVIAGVATVVGAMLGPAEKGPVGVATEINSASDYRRIFGGYIANSELAQHVDGYFDAATKKGGVGKLYVTRVVHYSDPADKTTAQCATGEKTIKTADVAASAGYVLATVVEPFSISNGDTLKVNPDAAGLSTATFSCTAAGVLAGNTATYNLTNGMTLTVKVDQGPVQTVTFLTAEFSNIAAATSAEVAAVLNAKLIGASGIVASSKPKIVSDKKGTGSYVEVTGGTANAVLGFSTSEVQGTGNVADSEAVTVAEVKTVVEAAVAGVTVSSVGGAVKITSDTTGATSSVLVDATSTLDSVFGIDNATHTGRDNGEIDTLTVSGKYPGAYSDDLSIVIAAASSGESAQFNLVVKRAGKTLETWTNLSMDDTDSRYVVSVINNAITGSAWITVADENADAETTSPNDRPANGTYTMTGGADGLSGLADADYVGTTTAKNGLRSFDTIDEISMLGAAGRATAVVHNAVVTYCEVTRGGAIFPFLDPPAGMTDGEIREYFKTTAGLKNLSEFGAMHWPRIKIANPDTSVFGTDSLITVGGSGDVMGLCAQNDQRKEGGIYEAPAGAGDEQWGRLSRARGLEDIGDGSEPHPVLDPEKRGQVFDDNINPLGPIDAKYIHLDGAKTLKAEGDFGRIPQRRGLIFQEQSIKKAITGKKHRNIKNRLLRECDNATSRFLIRQTAAGAFDTEDPEVAFKVDFGTGLNTPSVSRQNLVKGRVGVRRPDLAEYFDLVFYRDQSALAQELGF